MAKAEIRSPLPGTFYRRPAPDQPEYKADGAEVAKGDTIGLVEVMKSFHDVPAEVAGRNIRFLVEDAEPVTAGQVIAEVEE
ncbi:MAG: biotin carboxyl carrier domain-containing protein [Pararhodobacter sp.]|nr:biotin carboxyl carrier domain-containing protein [Pararhodobacter sp.]